MYAGVRDIASAAQISGVVPVLLDVTDHDRLTMAACPGKPINWVSE